MESSSSVRTFDVYENLLLGPSFRSCFFGGYEELLRDPGFRSCLFGVNDSNSVFVTPQSLNVDCNEVIRHLTDDIELHCVTEDYIPQNIEYDRVKEELFLFLPLEWVFERSELSKFSHFSARGPKVLREFFLALVHKPFAKNFRRELLRIEYNGS